MTEDQIKHMAHRFLWWRLPENFNPDCGIHFDADAAIKMNPRNRRYEPVGTNLFDATQAEEMVRHMVDKKKGRFWIEPQHAPELIRKIIGAITGIAYRSAQSFSSMEITAADRKAAKLKSEPIMLAEKCHECDGPRSACSCPRASEDGGPVCKDKGGLVGASGECLLCDAEAGEVCR